MLFADASYEHSMMKAVIAALLSRAESSAPFASSDSLLTPAATLPDVELFSAASRISGLELSTLVATIFALRRRLSSRAVAIYVDNNAALLAMFPGDSSPPVAARLVAFAWHLAAVYDITMWFERAASAADVADFPAPAKPPLCRLWRGGPFHRPLIVLSTTALKCRLAGCLKRWPRLMAHPPHILSDNWGVI